MGRAKTGDELTKDLDEFKAELAQLRVAKVTGGAASKLMKIKTVRRSIARVLTVYNEQQRNDAKKKFKGKKFVPKDLRPRKTRAIRRRLTKAQQFAKTQKQKV